MTDKTQAARDEAASDFSKNPQTPKADEQSFDHYDSRNAYNAELERQRQSNS